MKLDELKKIFSPVESGFCLNKCKKKIINDENNEKQFIVVCNSCKRIIFEFESENPNKTKNKFENWNLT
jgi:hypothetical protein